MGAISRKVVDQIRNAADICQIISGYLPLKRAGSGFKALCPFHREKTPSFHVNPQLQIYHCFGCGRGGDVFRFIMEYERVDFPTAVRILADRLGVALEYDKARPSENGVDRPALYRLLEQVAQHFHQMLLRAPEAAAAREYLKKRELWGEAVERFLLGYAPAGGPGLLAWARKHGFSAKQMIAAGLVIRREDASGEARYVDRFTDRITFPIHDEAGRVVAFSARVLESDARTAKYVNSPDTMIFRKGRVLYGLSQARSAITASNTAILCEGQIDVIRCHLAGITTAVASQGTAVTPEQAALLSRYADRVIVLLDADAAGEEAAIRAGRILLGAGLEVSLVALPAGEDPDSLIRSGGAEALQQVLQESTDLLKFHFRALKKREDLSSQSGLTRATAALMETIRAAPQPVQWDFLIRRAADLLRVDESLLREQLRRSRSRAPAVLQPEDGELTTRPQRPEEEVALVELLLGHPEVCVPLVQRYLHLEDLQDTTCRTLISAILHPRPAKSADEVRDRLPPDDAAAASLFAELCMRPTRASLSERGPESAVQDVILTVRRKALERRRDRIRQQLREAKDEGECQRLRLESKQLMVDIAWLRQGWEKAAALLEMH